MVEPRLARSSGSDRTPKAQPGRFGAELALPAALQAGFPAGSPAGAEPVGQSVEQA